MPIELVKCSWFKTSNWQLIVMNSFPILNTSSLRSLFTSLSGILLPDWHTLTSNIFLSEAVSTVVFTNHPTSVFFFLVSTAFPVNNIYSYLHILGMCVWWFESRVMLNPKTWLYIQANSSARAAAVCVLLTLSYKKKEKEKKP